MDTTTNLGIFQIAFYDSLKIKVSAITIYSDNIIVGDEKGNIYLFQINMTIRLIMYMKIKLVILCMRCLI